MKKVILSIVTCLCFACTFEEPRRDGEEEVYQIVCEDRRVKTGYKKYYIKYSEWRSPYIYRSSIWSFRDINGKWHRSTFPCYTNNVKRRIKK